VHEYELYLFSSEKLSAMNSPTNLLPTILFLFFDRIVAFTIYDPFDQTQDMFTIVYWSKIRVFLCSFVVYIPRNLRPSAVKLFFEV
jgi:hypothetical protein